MKNSRSFKLADLALIVLITTVLAVLLLPVFMKVRTLQSSRCQSNMYRIGTAIHMYLSDWDYTYPTNRPLNIGTNPPSLMQTVSYVRLSDPFREAIQGQQIRFQYGVNWVEALYPYIERPSFNATPSVWKCPVARDAKGPGQTGFAAVTYAFNMNLVEYPKAQVKNISKVMMIREMDRLYESVTRPTNKSLTYSTPPYDPFLDPWQDKTFIKGINTRLHGEGSHILFADGHVKGYPAAYFNQASGKWDTFSQQWWNHVDDVPMDNPMRKTVAISP